MDSEKIHGYEVDTIELKKLMIENHIDTIDEFSAKIGVNRNTLADVINGRSYPSSIVMQKIALEFRLTHDFAGKIFFKEKLA